MFIMIKSLVTLGNLLSRDDVDIHEGDLTNEQVRQWVAVAHAVANNGDISQAVCDWDLEPFGSDIVHLIGSLRSKELVQCVSNKIQWNGLIHKQTNETNAQSQYHKYSYRSRLLANLTEYEFWTREFSSSRFEDDTFDNIAFVFHTCVEQKSFSFDHCVASQLFGHPIPLGTAVLAHQLGETYYIFEDTPFSNIAVEHQQDFFIAGCLHMGARERLDWEDRTLGYGRLKELIETLQQVDVNAVYAPSDYLCQTFGWPIGTQCPLGIVGLAVLSGSPIETVQSVSFANFVCSSLTLENIEQSFGLMGTALLHTTSWNTQMGQEDFGPINLAVVSHFISCAPQAARTFILNMFDTFEQRPFVQQDNIRSFLTKASAVPASIFSEEDASEFLSGVFRIFDVRKAALHRIWSSQNCWTRWWDSGFDDSLDWFNSSGKQNIQVFMEPYLSSMRRIALNYQDNEERLQAKLMLETFNSSEIGSAQVRRKSKM